MRGTEALSVHLEVVVGGLVLQLCGEDRALQDGGWVEGLHHGGRRRVQSGRHHGRLSFIITQTP